MVRPVHFTYRIERDTRRPVAVAASAYRMPLDTPADYARAALAETAGDLYDAGDALGGERRVLLDHVQYFAFLAEITARIRDAVHPEARVFIEVARRISARCRPNCSRRTCCSACTCTTKHCDAARGAPVVDRRPDPARRGVRRRQPRAARSGARADAFDAQLRGAWPAYAIRLDPHPAAPRAAADDATDSAHHAARPGRP